MTDPDPMARLHLELTGLPGLPEVRPGDDLAALLEPALRDAGAADGDVVVVGSKVVAKAEGRLREDAARAELVAEETVEVVAEWEGAEGRTVIARTAHGLVLAAAGVDASNTEPGTHVLLPVDPDESARRLRAALRDRLGVRLGVLVTDTLGRPWREGQVDVAVGCAGLAPVQDLRGQRDAYGNVLEVTVVATADEVAAASELVRPKLGAVPAALVRGLQDAVTDDDGPGAVSLVRPAATDRFPLGSREAVRAALRAYATGTPTMAPTGDGMAQAVAAVQAALPAVQVLLLPGNEVEIDAPDAEHALEARVLLRLAMLAEGLTPLE